MKSRIKNLLVETSNITGTCPIEIAKKWRNALTAKGDQLGAVVVTAVIEDLERNG
jgi:hypothetical protein